MKQFKQKITATASAILIALTVVGTNLDQAFAKGKARKGANGSAGSKVGIAPKGAMSVLQNAENVRSQAERRKAAGVEGFSIDIGTSENLILQTESARRKTTKRTRQ